MMASQALYALAITILVAEVSISASAPTPRWATSIKTGKDTTTTNLKFYFHDTLSGTSPSAVRIAQAPVTGNSKTLFGAVLMADDPLTEGPDPKSKMVGRAQGLYGSACQSELGLIMAMNYQFIDGEFKGSSFSILGLNQAMNPVREMPVVTGTGKFRMARGYALAHTHWFDKATGDAIVMYNVTIIH